MIIVYITPIKNLTDTEIARILNSLSENSIARLNKKRNKAQHLSSLCALSLIPKGMSADLDHAESGKPFFKMRKTVLDSKWKSFAERDIK